ncbi:MULTISPECIES: ABC transporter substrate-binding protein [unclassified Bordetella]|uniref:ABC transporter substrate-binding protein n=1 Tax=unclassified Bordetella TaxID=2630031 RepID=UPI001321C51C|nr:MULTISPECIES: ABC transporter substrate-binding protein [unclassified Bordetella]MVW70432.1 transporter substrate-binding domain-containing protein [Bordetella sp. 15P40C-2]MVW78628.1 transporter substrate-binding domain-containing protein [Bordetella sp. 02P26C-1]
MVKKQMLKYLPLVACLGMGSVAHADALSDIKSRGTLVCGTLGTSEPFSFQDPQTRQVVGYEIDLCKAIADDLGVKLDVKMISVAARIPELAGGRVDVVAANLGWTPERAKQIDYSYQHYVSPQKILLRRDDAGSLKTNADFAGKRVSAVAGSSSEAGAKRLIPDVTTVTFKDPPTAFVALQQRKVSGFVGSELMLLKFKQDAENSPVQLELIEEPLFVEPWGIGMRKGESALQAEVNKTLTKLENSGEMQKIFDRWFGPDSKFPTKRVFKVEEIKG